MDMDGKAIELIQASAKAEHHEQEIGGVLFSTKTMAPIYHDPRPEPVQLHSLTGVVDFLAADIDGLDKKKILLHVVSPGLVNLVSEADGPALKRTFWAQASIDPNAFKFNQKYSAEDFHIALQALFVDSEDRKKVLQIVGTIKSEHAETSLDDGVQQKVETKRGLVLGTGSESIPNPVELEPWRTFREVAQPSSFFIFRAHDGPAFALYEADGAAWKLEAMQSIKEWLAERLPDIAIIA
jgi:hypothetical protein